MHIFPLCFSFTGGDTGVSISKRAGMIPLQMELGGKDACIVLDDADLDLAAANIVKGGFSYRFSPYKQGKHMKYMALLLRYWKKLCFYLFSQLFTYTWSKN